MIWNRSPGFFIRHAAVFMDCFAVLSFYILQCSGIFFAGANLYDSVNIVYKNLAITDVTGSVLPPDRLTMDEKIRIVDDLHQAGIFYMKGAVSEVAAQLGSSEATIYRYLSKLKD